ncbi:LytR family transcriptional regulator, partial [Streptomyces sp. SID10692]|nr:LytR family transcriptional regulator [Streptomyces sp. SID10692]
MTDSAGPPSDPDHQAGDTPQGRSQEKSGPEGAPPGDGGDGRTASPGEAGKPADAGKAEKPATARKPAAAGEATGSSAEAAGDA